MGGFVYILDPVGLSNELSCEAGSFSHCCNTHTFFQLEVLRLHFPELGCEVYLAPQLFLPVYLHENVGLPSLRVATLPALVLQLLPCHESSPPWLPITAPPTRLDEYFFLNSLVVGPPYSSIS